MVTKDTVALANTHGASGSAQCSATFTPVPDRAAGSGLRGDLAALAGAGARVYTGAAATEPTDQTAETTKGVASGKAANCANRPENSGPSAKPEVSATPAITVPDLPRRSAAHAVPAPIARPAPIPTTRRPTMSPGASC